MEDDDRGADDRLAGDMVLSETVNWMKKTEAGVVVGEAEELMATLCAALAAGPGALPRRLAAASFGVFGPHRPVRGL